MSDVESALTRVQAFALRSGFAKLAREAGVDEDTTRRLLKNPPKQVMNLIALENAMERLIGTAP